MCPLTLQTHGFEVPCLVFGAVCSWLDSLDQRVSFIFAMSSPRGCLDLTGLALLIGLAVTSEDPSTWDESKPDSPTMDGEVVLTRPPTMAAMQGTTKPGSHTIPQTTSFHALGSQVLMDTSICSAIVVFTMDIPIALAGCAIHRVSDGSLHRVPSMPADDQ